MAPHSKAQLSAALRLLKEAHRHVQSAEQSLAGDSEAVARLADIRERINAEIEWLSRLRAAQP